MSIAEMGNGMMGGCDNDDGGFGARMGWEGPPKPGGLRQSTASRESQWCLSGASVVRPLRWGDGSCSALCRRGSGERGSW